MKTSINATRTGENETVGQLSNRSKTDSDARRQSDCRRGFLDIPLAGSSGDAPPVGGTWVYNEVASKAYKAKKPVMPGYFDVRDFGAVGDFELGNPDSATDDLPAFEHALEAMAAYHGNSACKLIADGHFYLSGTLHLRQSCIILGSGRSEPGAPIPPRFLFWILK
jgi:hypothetical protein